MGVSASAVNGKSLRFPTQATEKLRAFRHSTFIALARLPTLRGVKPRVRGVATLDK
jgi:hypothetical protein